VINAGGCVAGWPLELVSRDDESNPGTGLVAARELVQHEEVAALIGGLDTPVSMTIVPFTPDDQDALGPQDGFVAPRG
jgi:branched-chain amino acid transport system substrate-binding protein